ncbi:hypothetical protein GCM10008931_42550 [Oceanobacillus oncorhynchi subsp. oncorhynchi]|uniref:DNA cytosine methyltransferase n=1 Tax=Oceanobacillus oncorhynchi TaxID=545501 RepID=UPI0031D78EFD
MPYAIDLFCGAGGFSEGIIQAGFDIIFSSDKSPMVQETYTNRHKQLGLIDGVDTHFELADIKDLHSDDIFKTINSLRYDEIFRPGTVDVIFGGPPCQGFSRLGKRDANDPRNMLFHEYLRLIKDIKPKYVVMENVTGILDMKLLDFPSVNINKRYAGQNSVPYILNNELEGIGYKVLDMKVLNAADFGVPQQRNRAIFLAYRNDVIPVAYPQPEKIKTTVYDAFGDLYTQYNYSTEYSKNCTVGRTCNKQTSKPVSVNEITNMETSKHDTTVLERFSLYREGENRRKALNRMIAEGIDLYNQNRDLFYETLFYVNNESNFSVIKDMLKKFNIDSKITESKRWFSITNKQLSIISKYSNDLDNNSIHFKNAILSLSRRLNMKYETTIEFWSKIKDLLNKKITESELDTLLVNGEISDDIADAIFTKKGIRTRLDSKKVAPTMVTLPDDYIHPYFNRILTVREMARLQSFDDSFTFLGKRTTGGEKRALETPQFTQVGNAVPPLLAKAIATEVFNALEKSKVNHFLNEAY